jgi:nucleotide-binding universal stress UspA family protein
MLPVLLALALQAGPATPGEGAPSPPPPGEGPVILFLVDNSASLPPLDPGEKRRVALERMLGFAEGQRERLILFGGKEEQSVDDTERYLSDGRWTDFYHAFRRAEEIVASYPEGTDVRLVLLTDAIVDPDPADWPDLAPGDDLVARNIRETVELLRRLGKPLYVILVGDPTSDTAVAAGREQSPGFVLDMVRASNGAAAAPFAQTLASFFDDDGMLLRKFIYRVRPGEGLAKIEPTVRRIASPPRANVELRIFGYFVLPLLLMLMALVGLLVHSFPGPGDLEIVELSVAQPVHVAADRLHRTRDGSWAAQGLSLVAGPREAAASLTLRGSEIDVTGTGVDTDGLDPADAALLPLDLDEVRKTIETATDTGSREEKIHALNLDYMAKSMSPQEAERILTRPPAERVQVPAVDFVRAKVLLAFDDALRDRLLARRLHVSTYGKEAARREVRRGDALRIGRYGFVVDRLERGGRRDALLALRYDRVPSLLGLKTILPDRLQRLLRFRRSRQRAVS